MSRRAAAAVAFVIAATSARPAVALVGGAVDGDSRGTVALLEGDAPETSKLRCSGVLIAPNVVLTARHCITEHVADSLGCEHDTEGAVRLDARHAWVTTATEFASTSELLRGTAWSLPASSASCGHDIALLTLETPVRDREALAAVVTPSFDTDAAMREASAGAITVVGYGATETSGGDRGTRRRRSGANLLCDGRHDSCRAFGDRLARTELLASAVACPGDSGGGAFVGSPPMLAGVLSRTLATSGQCGMSIFSTLEPHALLFARTVRAAAAVAGTAVPAWVANAEARGNAPGVPRALGAPCDGDDDCAASACRSADRGFTFVCAASCESSCGAGESCRAVRTPDGSEDAACVATPPETSRGCATSPGDATTLALPILAALASILGIARRRR